MGATSYIGSLFSQQLVVYNQILQRVTTGRPTILWAGRQAGVSYICRVLSSVLESMPQIGIGLDHDEFDGFLFDVENFFHPLELPLRFEDNCSAVWDKITPVTLVFIDDLFSMPGSEELYNRVLSITPHVIASGQMDSADWNVSNYVDHIIGPYATWELNPLLDQTTLRSSRPVGLNNKHTYNKEVTACVQPDAWRGWSKK
jgi:hypothetical protein